ncbi:MAG: helix-hairpin-helix domain-containing protein [Spirochaetales bacterium]|uniref:Helix-hairpin-helix domain-containing protein n=1 Tax=Candidatus Thalassospirochaeta sargassi TaxID=3119039 RepID=A0AAJ1IE08_9SPIO|nr:helix-hairpin-helix domain-containing protein [Spirochaetales bacterium]
MLSNKVEKLAESARYDVCMSSCSTGSAGRPGRIRKPENPLSEWIYPASVPGQGTVHILKILQSNSCRNNCSYCKFSASRDDENRVSLSPGELAGSFIKMVRQGLVEGLFLSSGVCRSPSFAMEEMIKTADILRNHFRFGGYIHLKIIPGCAEHLIDAAASFADRLSVNIEAPSARHLSFIAPEKKLSTDILPAAKRTAALLRAKKNGYTDKAIRASSQTTQYVVGAAGESDLDIMTSVDMLYSDYFMFRAYFSAYQQRYNPAAKSNNPKKDSPGFEGSPLLREHRLYQSDFLLRAYGFSFPELVFDSMGNIPMETDPKTAWALMNPGIFPVEVNTAPFAELIRVPGIGPVSAERIVRIRRREKLNDIEELKAAGAWSRRAAGWIELNGQTPYISDEGSKKHSKNVHFIPGQKWLFEELAPDGWKTAGQSTGKASLRNKSYPGQTGKWVNYQFNKSDRKIWCR